MKTTVCILVAALALAGCAGSNSAVKGPRVAGKASDVQRAELLERVKKLDGTWEMTDEKGQKSTLVFKTISNGSAVREIMFPDSPHEMTNMYHMDGATLVVTHYCAAGNQPRMRATHADGNAIHFTFDSITNMAASDEGYMGEMTLVFSDTDHLTQRWKYFEGGKVTEGPDFVLTRKH